MTEGLRTPAPSVWAMPCSHPKAARAAGSWLFTQTKHADDPAYKTPKCDPVGGGQVPVRGMFMLMLAFAILVGPANYFFCARKNKRIWMLWTSPALSALFIGVVFAYALLSDGIRPWGRSVVVTLLDEKSHMAATLGTTAWYAPMGAGSGLQFCAVRGGAHGGQGNQPIRLP